MGYDLDQCSLRIVMGKVVQSKVGTDRGGFYSMHNKSVKDFGFF